MSRPHENNAAAKQDGNSAHVKLPRSESAYKAILARSSETRSTNESQAKK